MKIRPLQDRILLPQSEGEARTAIGCCTENTPGTRSPSRERRSGSCARKTSSQFSAERGIELIAWLVVTLCLALAVERPLDRKYPPFWHRDCMRLNLQKALGLG